MKVEDCGQCFTTDSGVYVPVCEAATEDYHNQLEEEVFTEKFEAYYNSFAHVVRIDHEFTVDVFTLKPINEK